MSAELLGGGDDVKPALVVLAAGVCSVVWVLTGLGTFWPGYVWMAAGIVFARDAIAARDAQRRAQQQTKEERALATHLEVSVLAVAVCCVIWVLSGGGSFWPAWVALWTGAAWVAHAVLKKGRAAPDAERARQLARRVDALEKTRRGVLDVQAAELRRIERDLHDGAQARLVALTMHLGRAESRLEDQPEIAALVRQAREEAGAAIAELRDLARGIAPPVLADRGLGPAVMALAERAPVEVTVAFDLPRRPPPVVEAAVYFVVAEALTNVAKHAPGSTASVRIEETAEDVVRTTIEDDGPGGVVPTGNGLSGLRQRVEALDGRLTIDSPPGGPTTITAEVPCGS